jgi:hypothetical protein
LNHFDLLEESSRQCVSLQFYTYSCFLDDLIWLLHTITSFGYCILLLILNQLYLFIGVLTMSSERLNDIDKPKPNSSLHMRRPKVLLLVNDICILQEELFLEMRKNATGSGDIFNLKLYNIFYCVEVPFCLASALIFVSFSAIT